MITLNIDVSKIDKSRLFQGKKGTYLDAVLIETPNSEYGDYMVVESISKEEREAGNKGTILGNGKIVGKREMPQPEDFKPNPPAGNPDYKGEDPANDLPF